MAETQAFTNDEVTVDALPLADEPVFEPLAAGYRRMMQLTWVGITAIVVSANVVASLVATNVLTRFLRPEVLPFAIVALLAVAATVAFLPGLVWRSKGYQLRDHDLHFKHGVIWRGVTSLPYVRVQHVELESGPVERLFKLATLKFYTAGGGAADMTIPGLPTGIATKVRAFVMKRAGAAGDAADEQSAEGADSNG